MFLIYHYKYNFSTTKKPLLKGEVKDRGRSSVFELKFDVIKTNETEDRPPVSLHLILFETLKKERYSFLKVNTVIITLGVFNGKSDAFACVISRNSCCILPGKSSYNTAKAGA